MQTVTHGERRQDRTIVAEALIDFQICCVECDKAGRISPSCFSSV